MLMPARQAYLETEVLQAEPLRLLQLLYRGALTAVGGARESLRAGNIAERSRRITRAEEIVFELSNSLDLERGGEVAFKLARLYEYVQLRLHEANCLQREEPLVEVENLLSTLLEGWENCSAKESYIRGEDHRSSAVWQVDERAASYSPLRLAG